MRGTSLIMIVVAGALALPAAALGEIRAGEATVTGNAQDAPAQTTQRSKAVAPPALVPPTASANQRPGTHTRVTANAWRDGVTDDVYTNRCFDSALEVLGGAWMGWFGEVNASPVVNQVYYTRIYWGVAGNPCAGGAYVAPEFGLPAGTSLAISAQNPVRCFGARPGRNFEEFARNECPQAAGNGRYGGLSFYPPPSTGVSAWPTATGAFFQIWVPVRSTVPLSGLIVGGAGQACPSCLYGAAWFIDGNFSPTSAPVQGVWVGGSASTPSPYVDYPVPNHIVQTCNPTYSGETTWTSGFIYTEGTSGNARTQLGTGPSGPYDVSTGSTPLSPGAWRLDQCWVVGGPSALPPGTYHFRVCYDPSGGAPEICGSNQSFTVPGAADSTVPNTSIASGPKPFTNRTSATFTFSSNELGASFECKLDGAATFTPCSAPTYTALAAGPHVLRVRAKDAAGNTDASPAVRTWTIDLTKPNTTITAGPLRSTAGSSATFRFTSSEPTGAKFQCKLDAGAWKSCISPKGYTGITRGQHTFRVRAIDRAGNVDATPAAKTWRR